MVEKQIYLHIGMPKCASTFLQNDVFPHLESFYYIGYEGDADNYSPIHTLMEEINKRQVSNRNLCDIDRLTYKESITNYISSIDKNKILISFEGFIGSTHDNFKSHNDIASLLAELFPFAKILIIIRRQYDFCESAYSFQFKKGYSKSINKFLNYYNSTFNEFRKPLNVSLFRNSQNIEVASLKYIHLVTTYCNLFGKENVMVVPFELLVNDKKEFLRHIYAYFELPRERHFYPESKSQNRAYSKVTAPIASVLNKVFIYLDLPFKLFESGYLFFYKRVRILLKNDPNCFLRRKHHNSRNFLLKQLWLCMRLVLKVVRFCSMPPGRSKNILLLKMDRYLLKRNKYQKVQWLTEEKRNMILNMHKGGNKRLAELTGLNLSKYGYF